MDAIWLKTYPFGVPAQINPDEYESLADFLTQACQAYADRDAYINFGITLKYAQLHERAQLFAHYLRQHLKLASGDRVAIMLPNVMQYPIIVLGTLMAGLAIVNVNPLYTARELKYQLKDSGAKVVVVLNHFAHIVQGVLPETDVQTVVTTGVGDLLPFWKRYPMHWFLKYIRRKIPDYAMQQAVSWDEVFKTAKRYEQRHYPVTADDIAFLQYTGGTTGVSKGAILTHRNMIANMLQITAWIKSFLPDPGESQERELVLTALPLYHIFSLTANLLTFMGRGAVNVLITNPRDIDHLISQMSQYKPFVITGVNTLFNALVNHARFLEIDFKKLHFTIGGGMAVQRAVAEAWHKVTGKPIIEAYGLTETAPAVTINPLNLDRYNGSIGLPIPSTMVALLDNAGLPVAPGTSGELCVKGPQVMRGYWQKPEETAEAFTSEGWFKTGDIATMDERGFLRIVDRKKDMILISGFNVYPNEIEGVLALHPGVLEVAAVGVPDMKSGEAVKIFVVKRDQMLTEETLRAYCRQNFTPYKQPKYIEFRSDLPKSNVGKILRRVLKQDI